MEKKDQWNVGYWIVAVLLLLTLQNYWQAAKKVEPVPYSEFEKALAEGRVAEVLVADRTVTGRLTSAMPSRTRSSHLAVVRAHGDRNGADPGLWQEGAFQTHLRSGEVH